mmetsp:Transcript_2605/g.5904  ORF Transcript_2605/g.5904 Transcript_2605/m.5904 type:complete len:90 (-) Transcript_2605:287-556(-)
MSKSKHIYRVPEGKDSTESLFKPRSYSNKAFRVNPPKRLPALSTAAPTSGTNSFFSKFESTTPPRTAMKKRRDSAQQATPMRSAALLVC